VQTQERSLAGPPEALYQQSRPDKPLIPPFDLKSFPCTNLDKSEVIFSIALGLGILFLFFIRNPFRLFRQSQI
jgi:hypothetical protein